MPERGLSGGEEGTNRPSTGNIRCGRHHVASKRSERQRGPVRLSVLERITPICNRDFGCKAEEQNGSFVGGSGLSGF